MEGRTDRLFEFLTITIKGASQSMFINQLNRYGSPHGRKKPKTASAHTDRQTDGPTDCLTILQNCETTSKKETIKSRGTNLEAFEMIYYSFIQGPTSSLDFFRIRIQARFPFQRQPASLKKTFPFTYMSIALYRLRFYVSLHLYKQVGSYVDTQEGSIVTETCLSRFQVFFLLLILPHLPVCLHFFLMTYHVFGLTATFTSNIAPAHPHATGVAVCPALSW